jgi:hypothetical protein
MKITLNENGLKSRSMSARIQEVMDEKVKPKVKARLIEIAGTLTALSPVWSGAYVTSHSFVPSGSGSGRMRKSSLDAGPVDVNGARGDGFNQLVSDINSFDFMEKGGIFRNRSPHSRAVEDGGVTPTGKQIPAYNVYRTAAARARAKGSI